MDKQNIGAKIKAKRKALKLSQEDLAELASVARQTVSAWERDFFVPKGKNLITLAKILRTSMDFFTAGEEDNSTISSEDDAQPVLEKEDVIISTPFELAPFAQIYDYAQQYACNGSPGSRTEAIRLLKLTIEEIEKNDLPK